jgi:hypothetical protein
MSFWNEERRWILRGSLGQNREEVGEGEILDISPNIV